MSSRDGAQTWRAIIVALALVTCWAASHPRSGSATPAAPAFTRTRYMASTAETAMMNQGCWEADHRPNGIVILDFGQPDKVSGVYGANIFTSPDFRSIATITEAVKDWIRGYWNCSVSGNSINVAVGTNNDDYTDQSIKNVTYAHGQAWADMVDALYAWLGTPPSYLSRVSVVGVNDIEPAFETYTETKAWVDGYNANGSRRYYNYGSADNCYSTNHTNSTCANGWNQSKVLYVSWLTVQGWPLPEIYVNNGNNALQWKQIKLYGIVYESTTMDFQGVMTQYQACLDVAGTAQACSASEDNTPSQGWSQLWDALNTTNAGDPPTAEGILWSTDISWKQCTTQSATQCP